MFYSVLAESLNLREIANIAQRLTALHSKDWAFGDAHSVRTFVTPRVCSICKTVYGREGMTKIAGEHAKEEQMLLMS